MIIFYRLTKAILVLEKETKDFTKIIFEDCFRRLISLECFFSILLQFQNYLSLSSRCLKSFSIKSLGSSPEKLSIILWNFSRLFSTLNQPQFNVPLLMHVVSGKKEIKMKNKCLNAISK